MTLVQVLVGGTPLPDNQLSPEQTEWNQGTQTLEQSYALGRIASQNSSATRPEYAGYVIYPDGTIVKDYSKVYFVNESIREEFLRNMERSVALLNIYGQPILYNLVAQDEVPITTTITPSITTTITPSITTPPLVILEDTSTVIKATILVTIIPAVIIEPVTYSIIVDVRPAETERQTTILKYPFNTTIERIPINLSTPILNKASDFLRDILATYVDEDRDLRTLLNFGEDRQNVILSYRYGNPDAVNARTLQVKLLQPIPSDIDLGNQAFISLELAKSTIDKVRVRFAPPIDSTPYLRPKNTGIKTNLDLGKSLNNVTLKLLGAETGSLGAYDSANNVSFEDQIYRRWYSFDFNSSELNLDFTDYNNFVFYGSAALRLEAFRQKLYKIESLTSQSLQFSGTVFTGSLASAGASYIMEQSAKFAKEKETTIRSFDRYEQYLYFTPSGSNSPYTASAWYADMGYEYNPIAYWPKYANGTLYSPLSETAQEWFVTQSAIAQRFDEFNENNLVNTIPTHVREHDDSAAYITFVAMIGHFFDIIKPYIDQFPNIYSRYIDPNEELSKDLVTDIAESVGFSLPTLNSIYSISDNILGTTEETPRRDYTVETHKRLLHNLPWFAKSKGTRTALTTLLKTFGITEQLINVKESGTSETSSLYVFDEFTSGLDFDSVANTYIELPIVNSNRTPLPTSLQFNLTVADSRNQTILTAGDNWALHVAPHPTISTLGRFELTSGSNQTTILSSSYEQIFGDELLNVSIRTYNTGSYASLTVTQVDGEDVIFQSVMSESLNANTFVPLWTSSATIQLGGSGSLVTGSYNGTIDEVRLWGINLTDEVTLNTAFDPGSNAGNVYDDASNYLYIQLSFNKIDTGSLPTYLINESPYIGKDGSPSLEVIQFIGVITTESFSRYNRTVRQLLPSTGGSGYVTRKIKIAPPPVFKAQSTTTNGVKQLSRTRSIVALEDKRVQVGRNKVSVSVSPTQFVNQNIIRNFGLQDINQAFGIPIDDKTAFGPTLNTLRNYYAQFYYVSVDVNKYIRILSELNSVLNQVVDYFIPSKATLLKGVTIEPNILERKKIPTLRKLRFYGANTRKTQNAAGSLTGSSPDYDATFNLSQKINILDSAQFGGVYQVYDNQHEDWLTANLVSQSLKPAKKVSIDLNPVKAQIGEYKVYDIQAENWHDAALISQSLKPSRKSKIDILTNVGESGKVDTYQTQHEDWLNSKLVSESKKAPRESKILTLPVQDIQGTYDTVGNQHEDWYRSMLIACGSASNKPAHIEQPIRPIETVYSTYGIQHEDWYNARLISNSLKAPRTVRVKLERTADGSYNTYDLQHLSWNEYAEISSSYVSQSYMPWPKQAIDLGLGNMNKFRYNAVNKGTDGAEPYNRIYARKLFDYEIEAVRPGGVTSIYPRALYEVPPAADFRDVGAYTYFNSPSGVYYVIQTFRTPKYTQPLNSEWNFDQQQFVGGVPTWSYGQSYNINDVVYQQTTIDSSDAGQLESVLDAARPGNGKYYVFKTRPSYTEPTDGTAFYSGSVPTFIPPSLDRENWARLRFGPVERRIPRRVVFDTFTILDPSLNNFTVTTIDINRIIDIPDRYLDVVSIGTLASGSSVQGEIGLQNIAALFALQASTDGLRIRLYRTLTDRTADLNRPSTEVPNADDGVLLDMAIGQANTTILVNPIVNLVAGSNPPLGKVFYTITNTSSTVKLGTNLLLYYFAIQIEPRVPSGYLRKHYRFFRDNSTATKRRNWLGCKNTVDTTIDGLPPVQIFVGEGSQLVVSQTQTNDEIITGGGGTLNVS